MRCLLRGRRKEASASVIPTTLFSSTIHPPARVKSGLFLFLPLLPLLPPPESPPIFRLSPPFFSASTAADRTMGCVDLKRPEARQPGSLPPFPPSLFSLLSSALGTSLLSSYPLLVVGELSRVTMASLRFCKDNGDDVFVLDVNRICSSEQCSSAHRRLRGPSLFSIQ